MTFSKSTCAAAFFLIFGITRQVFAQCSSNPVANLVQNGNFESGNTGFTSGYDYCNAQNCLYPEGYYAVGVNANFFHSAFTGFDHTTGSGNFMVVNGAGSPNAIIWTETITVLAGVNYNFSAWVSSMDISNPAALQFQINSTNVGAVFNAPSDINDWANFFVTWNSGTATTATITILNQNTTLGGNDFGLDDISFLEVCPAPQPNLGSDTSLCGHTSITLNANITPTAATSIYWYDGTNGTGITAPVTHSISTAGTYWVCVKEGTCYKTDTIKVTAAFSINLGPDITLCQTTSITLDAGYQNSFTTYKWYLNGTVIPDSTSRTFFANSPGTYKVAVTDNSCSLTETDQIVITAVSALPVNSTFCPPSLATFKVTPNPSGAFKWYSAASGGTYLGSGNSISLPYSSTTTIYAQDTTSYEYTIGPNTQFPSGFPSTDFTKYITFDALDNFTLISVTIFANVYNPNTTMTIGVTLEDNTGTVLSSASVPVTGPNYVPTGNIWPFTVPVNIAIPKQNNLRLSAQGTSGQLFFAQQGSNNVTWPYTVAGVISLKSMDPSDSWGGCECYGYFYNWQIEKGTSCARTPVVASNSCALPVKWLSISAEPGNDGTATILWTVTDEQNISYYQIETSSDGVTFHSIGTVSPSSGNSITSYQYQYKPDLSTGTVYYRITELDYNGTASYSKIVSLETHEQVLVYPNPVTDILTIQFASSFNLSRLELINSIGQTLLTKENIKSPAHINIEFATPGVYILKLYNQNSVKVFKLVKE